MGLFNECSSTTKTDSSSTQGIPGPQGIGYKLDANGNFDIENKKLTNVKNGNENNDVMNKSQIESYVSNKTIYLENVNPGQVINNKAVIYSNTGSVHSNALYLKDRYGQETILHNEDQDDNQIRLYIPNLKNNDSFGGRLKSSIVITSISQTIEGKKIFHDIEVPTPTINGHASNKAYVDNEISKISDASDNSNYVKKTGDTMTGSLIVQKDDYPIQGDLNKVINYESQREIFVSRWETRQMKTSIDMNGNTIDNLPAPKNNDQAISKGYGDINYLNKLNGGQIGGNIDMRGNTIRYLGLEKALDSAARVNELNQKADKTELNDYMMLDGSKTMTGKLNMGGNRITGLTQTPYYNGEATNKMYVDDKVNSKADLNDLNKYLKLDGSKAMNSDLNMNNHLITNLKNPENDTDAVNKQYLNNNMINPSHTPKNILSYIMSDIDQTTAEYGIQVDRIDDYQNSFHAYNKKVIYLKILKNGNNYRSRIGYNIYQLIDKTKNKFYTACIEWLTTDNNAWTKMKVYMNITSGSITSNQTKKFEIDGLYYTRTIVQFEVLAISSPPIYLLSTIHIDGVNPTYPDRFSEIYNIIYGTDGLHSSLTSNTYDFHNMYELKNNKMTMNVDINMNNKILTGLKAPWANSDAVSKRYLDDKIEPVNEAYDFTNIEVKMLKNLNMNNNSIINIPMTMDGYIFIYGSVDANKFFKINSNILLRLRKIQISFIIVHGTTLTSNNQDILKITDRISGENRYNFTFPQHSGYALIVIDRYFKSINYIQLQNSTNVAFELAYNLFI